MEKHELSRTSGRRSGQATEFGFHRTALDVVRNVDLTGFQVVLTGASSGIGIETARALAKAGAHLGLDAMLKQRLMPANLLYAAGADLAHPYLSPLFGDFSKGFPPTFIQAGTRDLFLSNAVRLHRALRAHALPAELHIFEGMPHGGFGGAAPEDRELNAEVARFVAALP